MRWSTPRRATAVAALALAVACPAAAAEKFCTSLAYTIRAAFSLQHADPCAPLRCLQMLYVAFIPLPVPSPIPACPPKKRPHTLPGRLPGSASLEHMYRVYALSARKLTWMWELPTVECVILLLAAGNRGRPFPPRVPAKLRALWRSAIRYLVSARPAFQVRLSCGRGRHPDHPRE